MLIKGLLCMATLFLVVSGMAYSHESSSILILNMPNESVLPRNFRSTHDAFIPNEDPVPNRAGLDQLNISGSAQFSEESLETILKSLDYPSPLFIVDLRQESHGFLNGDAVSWFAPRDWGNKDKSLQQIEKEEKGLLQAILKDGKVNIHQILKKNDAENRLPDTKASSLVVKRALTERELLAESGIGYFRIPVTDHVAPTQENVDVFISFVQCLPNERWLHFHCAAGQGRTTTFMTMYDMMFNAKKISFDDIIKRQCLIGGLDLVKITNKNPWKHNLKKERIQFLKDFYEYCRTNQDGYKQKWSDYLTSKSKGSTATP
jgi:hypothetical protein